MKKLLLAIFLLALTLSPLPSSAFCGFYVAKADSKLFNHASKVVLAYNQGRAVITMANDYQGDLKEFAIVIPVPTSITREQIHVTENALIDQLDAYSAPRLVEYFDENPCRPRMEMMAMAAPGSAMKKGSDAARANALGVKIEAQYTVGEYDIAILSAEQSDGLITYLNESGYKLPPRAEKVLGSYIKQNMHFFVAKVNLDEQAKLGYSYLRPLQIAYNSPKFMLPIRLGTLNAPEPDKSMPIAGYLRDEQEKDGIKKTQDETQRRIYDDGSQDIILMVLSKNGRVEPTNYRTVKIDNDKDVPLFIKDEFADFYRAMFQRRAKAEGSAVFLEYAWDMAWCDPCAADPLRPDQLKELGVFWLDEQTPPDVMPMQGSTRLNAIKNKMVGIAGNPNNLIGGYMLPQPAMPVPSPGGRGVPVAMPFVPPNGVNTFITRLHARYNAQTFPEDIMLQETSDRENFQGRFILRHPWKPTGADAVAGSEQGERTAGEARDYNCRELQQQYLQTLPTRYAHEAETLARMTGWDINTIRDKMNKYGQTLDNNPVPVEGKEWWKGMWKDKQ